MTRYSSVSDDFYANLNLNTEMDLPQNREAILHFFEQIQKKYPSLRNFYCRDRSEFVLEEDKDLPTYRWASVEARRVCSGHVNPTDLDEAMDLHRLVLEHLPYALSVSPLECESLNLTAGFDYTYRGNHNEIVAEALGFTPAFERMAEMPGASVINCEPSMQLALDEECRTQCRLSVETRTNAYHVRTGEYPEDQLSVYFTVRRYGGLNPGETYTAVFDHLSERCWDIVDNYIIPQVLEPLQHAIAIK